jgi:UDP-2,3-diacylglucosamine hydrolase
MHGDLLCTRDRGYQFFRRFMEMAAVRRLFLCLPYALRALVAHGLRPLMRRSTAGKPPEIIDVEPGAVRREMEAAGVLDLIHGHTHRPGTHRVELAAGTGTRTVLGDWYRGAEILVCRKDGRRLLAVAEFLDRDGD